MRPSAKKSSNSCLISHSVNYYRLGLYAGSYTFNKTIAFHIAVAYGHPLALLRLLEEKIDVESRFDNVELQSTLEFYNKYHGWTLLEVAATNRDVEVAAILLQSGADVNDRREDQEPFLCSIVGEERRLHDYTMMHLLLDHGARMEDKKKQLTEYQRRNSSKGLELVDGLVKESFLEYHWPRAEADLG